jgi:hypothetical protein
LWESQTTNPTQSLSTNLWEEDSPLSLRLAEAMDHTSRDILNWDSRGNKEEVIRGTDMGVIVLTQVESMEETVLIQVVVESMDVGVAVDIDQESIYLPFPNKLQVK